MNRNLGTKSRLLIKTKILISIVHLRWIYYNTGSNDVSLTLNLQYYIVYDFVTTFTDLQRLVQDKGESYQSPTAPLGHKEILVRDL